MSSKQEQKGKENIPEEEEEEHETWNLGFLKNFLVGQEMKNPTERLN